MEQKKFQQGEFLGGKWNGHLPAGSPAAMAVKLQVGIVELGIAAVQAPPDESTHAREEFRKHKRLRKVVVRSGVEPLDTLLDQAAGRQHKNGSFHSLLAQFPADLNAAESRQAHIQENGVVSYVGGKLQRLLAALGNINRIGVSRSARAMKLATFRSSSTSRIRIGLRS